MIHKTAGFLKSNAKKAHKWLGFGPSISILAISIVGLITVFTTPSAKLQVASMYSPDPSEISGGSALFGDSSTIGEFSEANSTDDFADPVLLDDSSYLNNSGTSSARSDQGGFIYVVKKGDYCGAIASKFNITVGRLVSANNLGKSCKLSVGQELSIPDMGSIKSVERVPNYSSLPDVSGYLSFPLRDGYNAFRYLNYDHVDLLSSCGVTIYASAEGLVDSAGSPENWNGGLGGFVKIEHLMNNGNNYYTYYAGTSKNLVSHGDIVEKGQAIAEVGNTGESDVQGCHLRFGVIEAKNPFGKYID